jgi:hypothetical protein
MTGASLKDLLSKVFTGILLEDLARQYGTVERERSLDIVSFVVALVLSRETIRRNFCILNAKFLSNVDKATSPDDRFVQAIACSAFK